MDLEDLDGRSPLALAAGQGHCQVVSQLLAAGADVDHQDSLSHRTALMEAVMEGHADIVMELLRCGADMSLEDSHGRSAEHFASLCGNSHILNLLKTPVVETED